MTDLLGFNMRRIAAFVRDVAARDAVGLRPILKRVHPDS